ncbi:unnamed protein product [Porites lobata]|uniref:Uncharacterized protein n=1 Tax=Porites lobata TaxID=104759 RepID=A0ABN8P270_9CNID|nr:unnamed protein product [Porites lobata]
MAGKGAARGLQRRECLRVVWSISCYKGSLLNHSDCDFSYNLGGLPVLVLRPPGGSGDENGEEDVEKVQCCKHENKYFRAVDFKKLASFGIKSRSGKLLFGVVLGSDNFNSSVMLGTNYHHHFRQDYLRKLESPFDIKRILTFLYPGVVM